MLQQIKAIQKTTKNTSIAINKMLNLYHFENENKAFVILKATLKALRDRLPQEEAIHLGTQLPALLRGFYYEGWGLNTQKSKSRTSDQFLDDVYFHLGGHEEIELDEAVPVAMKVILDMIDQGEAIDVLHNLPKEIRVLCP
jgi:uncharacterized protein (DUF2267 family)